MVTYRILMGCWWSNELHFMCLPTLLFCCQWANSIIKSISKWRLHCKSKYSHLEQRVGLPASYIISLLYNLWVYLLSSYSIIWRLIIIIMIIKINNNFIIHTVPCLAHSRNSDINQFIISFQIVAISKASWKEKKEVGSTLLLKPTTWLSFPNSTQQILSKLKDD